MKLLDKNEKIQHVKNLDTTDRGVIDLLERDDYIDLDCGAVIRVTRPHIAKTLWLHDSDAERHGESERDKLETFIAYNMRYGLAPLRERIPQMARRCMPCAPTPIRALQET